MNMLVEGLCIGRVMVGVTREAFDFKVEIFTHLCIIVVVVIALIGFSMVEPVLRAIDVRASVMIGVFGDTAIAVVSGICVNALDAVNANI